ncbi:MAG: hypothetical protein GX595_19695, partial [Lentisphaerae bacterium]|nr:hypothetical protein [Lentisphaerota bacterium]
MKTRIFRVVAALASLAFGVGHAAAALTGGGVAIELDEAARVTGLAVAGQALATTPAPFVELCNVATGHYLAGRLTSREGGLWHLRFDEARAEVVLAIRADDGALRLVCTVRGEPLPARGLLLRFNLPLDAVGWQWHSDMQQAETVLATKTYANVRPLRAYADLPEWSDQPDLRMGYSNRNFCTVLSGPVGLCLAVPMDRPCLFRTAYDAPGRRLEIVYDFALAAETRQPHQAEFAFDLYACDPAWGFRDALARYYALYPELFKVHIREQGQWMAFNRLSQIDNVNEFGFGLQEGASEPDYDDRIGVLSTTYFTHAGMGANLPDYDPEKDPLPPLEAQVAAVEAAFRRTTGQDGVFHQVGLHTAEGLMDVRKWRVYNHLIAQFNLDPELAYGAWTLKRALGQTDDIKARLKADLDGFYYDGLSAGVNYRTEHFATADAPCLWDPVAKKPFINNFFSSCEFARAAAELLRPRGQITMMNGAVGASFFVAPWLDVLGEETGLILPREGLNYIRATTYQKPFMTLLKGNYEQTLGHAEIELFMRRCLAYGIFPGFFDWPPSGLGPGGQYWNHPRYYERDRDLFRTYLPLCRALALAGWEPVTQARCDHPRLAVERFGPDDDGVVWLTILNEEPTAQDTLLTIWPAALGLDAAALRATDILNDTRVALQRDGDTLSAAVRLPADGVLALQLATPAQSARWRARAALAAFESGRHMRDLDRGRPARPVHWRAPDAALERADGGRGVVLKAETAPSMSQWVMLFQDQPRAVTLRVRAAAAGLDRPAGAVGIVCRKAWVSPSYTYYKEETFELPVGTYEARDLSFTITSEQPLRAIQVTAFIKAGTPGRLTLSELSMTDGGRTEVVVDPQFAEWYEPVPPMTAALTAGEAALGRALSGLADAAGPDAATQGRLAEAAAACRGLREAVDADGTAKGARRLLRDLDTIERHLGQVALSAYSLEPPRIVGPTQAVPGSTIALAMATPRVEGLATTVAMTCAGAALTPTPDGARLAIPATAAVG